ncbi:MAG TPA: lipase secretion chaperone [Candidatus Dormibacteraeota bacterium]|nr:lipase secretion chaperone [Candidatus Dormibacteraeota bacterium]
MRRVALVAAVVAMGAALTAAWWGSAPRDAAAPGAPGVGNARRAVAEPATTHRDAVEAAMRAAGAVAPRLWERPASLDGTEADGAFAADAAGNLIVSPELRRAFEYWFAASGEESDARIQARIAAEIRTRLDDPAQAAALALLARFVEYRERGRALATSEPADVDLAARAAAVRDLRRAVFGADAEALFSDEEALVAFALAERRVASDPTLSDSERAEQLAKLLADAREPIRAARAAATAPMQLARDEAVLRAEGGSADDVQRLREERVGAEAAQRLAALDDARAAWRERVASYRAARAAIDADPALDDAARASAVSALRARHFNGAELTRIDALDRIEME